ncbi:hypothetical protein [Leeuwenhoekiella sp. LLG6367-2.1]|uniref:hypothetical protein n=1 Tax=Leeuwenhoekiella sp. LLG6367-2.1 TaxID=3160833 RepID=UPI0038643979
MNKVLDFFGGGGGLLIVVFFTISGFLFSTFIMLLICNKLNTNKTVKQMEKLLKAVSRNNNPRP